MNKEIYKKMFGIMRPPIIEFGLTDIVQKAQDLTGKLSISGVQPKLSVKIDKTLGILMVAAVGGEYILKPQTQSFANIPENEQCCMDIAENLGIDVPYHCLLELQDQSLAYIITRFDREGGKKIHQEDFAQILGQDKYSGSVEQIGKKFKEISAAPGYDMQLFFERVVLNFILGNGDAHLKNYSISYRNNEIRLAPAYDIVCSRLVIQNEEDSALTINGKKNGLSRVDFDALAEYLNVPPKVRYEKFNGKLEAVTAVISACALTQDKQALFLEIVRHRMERLELL